MSLRTRFSSKPLHPIQMAWFILMELLLLFGETFSKFHVYGPFHLFDLCFLLLSLWSLFYFVRRPKSFLVWPIIIILVFSVAYLFYSYFAKLGPINYMVRQYALFIYLGISWLLFASFISPTYQKFNVRLITLMALATVGLQLLYHSYLAIFAEDYTVFGAFNYYNKMAVMTLIVAGAFGLVYIKKIGLKLLVGVLYLLLATTMGHSSAFLASFFVISAYLVLKASKAVKIAGLVLSVLALAVFILYLPQFSDHNAEWRLVFWKISLKEIIFDNYAVIGNGFGVPYSSQAVLDVFRESLNSPWFEMRPEEQYLSPMHNSFITIAFHIGLVPALLVLVPLIPAFKYLFFSSREEHTSTNDFLLLALLGSSVWVSFNVVLELPHSATFYWFIYFSLIYSLKGVASKAT